METGWTLVAPGKREVITEELGKEILEFLESEIKKHDQGPTKLVLAGKSYTKEAAAILAPLIKGLSCKSIDYSDIIASRPTDEGLEVLRLLSECLDISILEEVNLSENALGVRGLEICLPLFKGKALRSISLCDNGLSESDLILLEETLVGAGLCGQLSKIHIFNNMIGPGGAAAFGRILDSCSEALVDLRYAGTRAGPKGSLALAQSFKSMGERGALKNLKYVDFGDCSFANDQDEDTYAATALASGIHACANTLESLILSDCGLKDDGVELVTEAFIDGAPNLKLLDLNANDVETKNGVKSLVNLMRLCPKLESLNLGTNELTSPGIESLLRALPQGDKSCLQNLKLNDTECGTIGAKALVVANFPQLKVLELDENGIPEKIVADLKEKYGEKLKSMNSNDDEDKDDQLDDDDDDDDDNDDDDDHDPVDQVTKGISNLEMV